MPPCSRRSRWNSSAGSPGSSSLITPPWVRPGLPSGMGLFRKRPAPGRRTPTAAESLQQQITSAGQPSLFAHSDFVKQVACQACGAPKRLPWKTAYLYCDHCGALVDYDFRLANAGTNAGLTNTVFHRLIAPVQPDLDRARAAGDRGRYRELLLRGVHRMAAGVPRGGVTAGQVRRGVPQTGWPPTLPNPSSARTRSRPRRAGGAAERGHRHAAAPARRPGPWLVSGTASGRWRRCSRN